MHSWGRTAALVGTAMWTLLVCHATAQKSKDAGLSPLEPAESSIPASGEELVDLELFVESPAVSRGGSTWLALQFRMEPKWHIYWHNSGDSGGPPEFTWDVPEGIEVGEPHWAVPEWYRYSGNSVDFVYHDEVTMLFPVHVDESFLGSDAKLSLDVAYLVCREVCLFGTGEASVTLAVGDMVTMEVQHQDVFEPARAAVPSDAASAVTSNWRGRTVSVAVPNATKLEVFPHRLPDGVSFRQFAERGAVERDRTRLRLDGPIENLNQIDLVVRAVVEGEEQLAAVSVGRGS